MSRARRDGPPDGATLAESALQARGSGWAHAAARAGLGSRALIYGLLTVLVVQVAVRARGAGDTDTDQGSSLLVLGGSPAGATVLIALIASVVAFSAWRASEAWLGTADPGHSRLSRVQAAIEGVAYLPIGYAALSILAGDDQQARQGSNYRRLSARVLGTVSGQFAVGLVGAVVIGVGVFFVVQGVRRTFLGHFEFGELPRWARRLIRWSGSVGCIGRGAMFVLAGVLVGYAAVTAEPRQAGGIDSALDALSRQPFGPLLLLLTAFGFASFAVFAVCEATWRRI